MELYGDLPKIDVILKIAKTLGMSCVEVLSHAFPDDLEHLAELAKVYHDVPEELRPDLIAYAKKLANASKETTA
jgi:hypothetical protein